MAEYTQCPMCGEWAVDLDGFGVLTHDACGFCAHPSITGHTCDSCGEVMQHV
jgi:hypothetical protein